MDPLYEDIEEKLISDKDFPSPLTSSFPSAVETPCNDGTCIPRNTTSSPWSLSYYLPKLDERKLLQCQTESGSSNPPKFSFPIGHHHTVNPPCAQNRTMTPKEWKGEKREEWFPSSLAWGERGILGQLRVAMGCQLVRHTAVTCAMHHTIQKAWSTMNATTPSLPPPSPLSCDPSFSNRPLSSSSRGHASTRSRAAAGESDTCGCGYEEDRARGSSIGTPTTVFSSSPLPFEDSKASNHTEGPSLPCPLRSYAHDVASLFGGEWESLPTTVHHHSHAFASSHCAEEDDAGELSHGRKKQERHTPPKPHKEQKERGVEGHPAAPLTLREPPTLSSIVSSSYTECTESVVLIGGSSPERFVWVLSDTTPVIQKRTKKEMIPHSHIPFPHPTTSSSSPPTTTIPSSSTSIEVQMGGRPVVVRNSLQRLSDTFHAWMARYYLSWAHFFLRPFTPYVGWGGHGSGAVWTNMTPVLFPSTTMLENVSFREDGMGEVRTDIQNLIAAHEFCQFFYWESSALQDVSRAATHPPAHRKDDQIKKIAGEEGVGGVLHDERVIHHFSSSSSSPAALFSHSTFRSKTQQPIHQRVTHEDISPPLPPRTITTTTTTTTTTVSGSTSWWSGFSSLTVWGDGAEEIIGFTPGLLLHVLLLLPCHLAVGIPSVFLTAAKHAFLSVIEETPAADSLVGTLSVNRAWRLECCFVLVMCCLFLIGFLVFTQIRYKKYTNALSHALKKAKKKKSVKESTSGTFS